MLTRVHLEGERVVVQDVIEELHGRVEFLDSVGGKVEVRVSNCVVDRHAADLFIAVQPEDGNSLVNSN